MKVVFVRSEDNHADIFTKNLNTEKFNEHCDAIGIREAQMNNSASKMENRKGVDDSGKVFATWN